MFCFLQAELAVGRCQWPAGAADEAKAEADLDRPAHEGLSQDGGPVDPQFLALLSI